MPTMLIFGLGYTATALSRRLRASGWTIRATGRDGDLDFADRDAVESALDAASHVLSSVPPGDGDPVLAGIAPVLRGKWLGYLSSTGVYGDAAGAWVDESAAIGGGRRTARSEADRAWQALGAHVFRLPGIYGPGRSPLDRVRAGAAHRVDLPGQVFSRVHVEDIVGGVIAALDAPAEVYNLADDLPASQNAVIDEACRLLGRDPPPFVALDRLAPGARAFYAENRRVANLKAKRVLGWRPAYPTFREGLRALSAMTSPTSATTDPATASVLQR
ncbi:MAG TPA: SDR family NAD(P)-dependent oxidoreductase [Novosphingobium sp.]|nr:SDR family NAD(P)-dependent oxidoreductase [Novosphingobium sp.]